MCHIVESFDFRVVKYFSSGKIFGGLKIFVVGEIFSSRCVVCVWDLAERLDFGV